MTINIAGVAIIGSLAVGYAALVLLFRIIRERKEAAEKRNRLSEFWQEAVEERRQASLRRRQQSHELSGLSRPPPAYAPNNWTDFEEEEESSVGSGSRGSSSESDSSFRIDIEGLNELGEPPPAYTPTVGPRDRSRLPYITSYPRGTALDGARVARLPPTPVPAS